MVTARRNILYLGAGRVGGAIQLPVQPPELNARAGCGEYLDEPFLYRKPFHATLTNSECQGRVGRTCLLNSGLPQTGSVVRVHGIPPPRRTGISPEWCFGFRASEVTNRGHRRSENP